MPSFVTWLLPWEFSPTVFAACLLACVVYAAGATIRRHAGRPAGAWRGCVFYLGVLLIYAVLQTRFDYLAQHMFWIHRLQHLVLHHVGPFLVMLAVPHAVMASGIPLRVRRRWLRPLWRQPVLRAAYGLVQQPLVAAVLFVGLIYYWLIPSVHFTAMLDARLYNAMNWSMVLDGLLFWWLVLDPRPRMRGARSGFGVRLLILWGIMIPQLLLGSYVALSRTDIYPVYAICGRIWPVSAITDQHLGGLITWIPACMMSVVAGLVVFARWVRSGREPLSMPAATLAPSATQH